jgi:hypothetical protein
MSITYVCPVNLPCSFCRQAHRVSVLLLHKRYGLVYTCGSLDSLGNIVQTHGKLLCSCLAVSQKAQQGPYCHNLLFDDFEFQCLGIAQAVHCNQPQNNESLHFRSIRLHRKYCPWTSSVSRSRVPFPFTWQTSFSEGY